jgi:hypothetical protein
MERLRGPWTGRSYLFSCLCRRTVMMPCRRIRYALPALTLRPGLGEVTRRQALGDVDLEHMLAQCLRCWNGAFPAYGGSRASPRADK